MTDHEAVRLAQQRKRWMRPDAHRYIRPDAARFLAPGADPADVFPALNYKYSPTQRRIPAGKPGGGQWTSEAESGGGGAGARMPTNPTGGDPGEVELGEGGWDYEGFDGLENVDEDLQAIDLQDVSPASGSEPINNEPPVQYRTSDPRIVSDADPDAVKPGEEYAQSGGRRTISSVRINGRTFDLTVRQSAELQGVQIQAEAATARVRELDPNWKPSPSEYQSVNGLIESYRVDAQQARDRIGELARMGVGPGPFAGESIPARSSERSFTAAERLEINRIGSQTGCQTCGILDPQTPKGNFVLDHQPPSALNSSGRAQRLYPQCLTCSLKQGGFVNSLLRGR